jgi:hypothetical protein
MEVLPSLADLEIDFLLKVRLRDCVCVVGKMAGFTYVGADKGAIKYVAIIVIEHVRKCMIFRV